MWSIRSCRWASSSKEKKNCTRNVTDKQHIRLCRKLFSFFHQTNRAVTGLEGLGNEWRKFVSFSFDKADSIESLPKVGPCTALNAVNLETFSEFFFSLYTSFNPPDNWYQSLVSHKWFKTKCHLNSQYALTVENNVNALHCRPNRGPTSIHIVWMIHLKFTWAGVLTRSKCYTPKH